MKYIKTFESHNNIVYNVYWRIDCKSLQYVRLSLDKIGLESDEQCYTDILKNFNKFEYFYLGKGFSEWDTWWFYTTNYSEFKKDNFKFLGRVKINKTELEIDKYNL